jgi:LSD1 subclass zinc finger protein
VPRRSPAQGDGDLQTYISECEPITQWLLTETQSPPILKVLRDFIPTLTPGISANLDKWSGLKSLFGRLTKLVEARNRLTHRGTWDVELGSLIEFREDVSDILYILDYLRGAKWARNNIRAATCQALNWPKPVTTQTQLRATVTVTTE